MKHLNERHQVIIESISSPKTDTEPKEGEIVEHSQKVYSLEFYSPNPTYRDNYIKIGLGRDFIVDLYNQIQEIEKIVELRPYKDIPF